MEERLDLSDLSDGVPEVVDAGPEPEPEPPPPSFYIQGRVRLYFNRHQDVPRVWCISDLDRRWELQLAHVDCDQVHFVTVYDPVAYHDPRAPGDKPPSAYQVSVDPVWVEVTLDRATIRPIPPPTPHLR